jgi:hypothetical protein
VSQLTRLIAKITLLVGGLLGILSLASVLGKQVHGPRWIDLYSGYIGVGLILLSLSYSIRKRWFKGKGRLKPWLTMHEYVAFIGGVIIFFHAAQRFRAGVPVLAIVMMTIVLASGFLGMELYKEIAKFKASAQQDTYQTSKKSALHWLKTWRTWHVQISLSLFVFTVLHFMLVGYFGGLK